MIFEDVCFVFRDIWEVDVADLCSLIPAECGVYDFGELGAAALVCTAGIDPLRRC
jgi:hypothetical protein